MWLTCYQLRRLLWPNLLSLLLFLFCSFLWFWHFHLFKFVLLLSFIRLQPHLLFPMHCNRHKALTQLTQPSILLWLQCQLLELQAYLVINIISTIDLFTLMIIVIINNTLFVPLTRIYLWIRPIILLALFMILYYYFRVHIHIYLLLLFVVQSHHVQLWQVFWELFILG